MIEENGPPDEKNGRIPYRCRHFDTVRRICRVYSSRPKMCERCGSSPESACSFPCSGPGAPGSVCYQVKKAQIDQVVRTVRGPARLPR
jgi:Fe-S-cluster containining protein